uniref:Uncharacterized protein n=1 Tax=Oryza punctata TaxID=4537 RepID=A0A0E0JLF5_ORYPU
MPSISSFDTISFNPLQRRGRPCVFDVFGARTKRRRSIIVVVLAAVDHRKPSCRVTVIVSPSRPKALKKFQESCTDEGDCRRLLELRSLSAIANSSLSALWPIRDIIVDLELLPLPGHPLHCRRCPDLFKPRSSFDELPSTS